MSVINFLGLALLKPTMTIRQRNIGLIVMLFLIATLCILYFDSVLERGPRGNHIWRQSDCLSITKKYQDGAPFLQPEMHFQWGDDFTSGKSAGEFPVLYYFTGNLWKLTGESFLVYRLVWLTIMVAGLMALFRTLQIIYESNIWSTFITLLIFASPAYAFYGVSFLSDAPAFGFLLMSLYFLALYGKYSKIKWLYLFGVFMALAGLLKASMLVTFVFFGMVFFLELIPKVKTLKGRKLFKHKWHSMVALGVVVILEVAWMLYARNYNNTHGYFYTFNEPHPYWKASNSYLADFWTNIRLYSLPVFHNRAMLFVLAISFVFNLFLFRKLPLLAYLANIFIALGCALYFLLWSGFIAAHDYYFVPFTILILSTFAISLYFLKMNVSNLFSGLSFKIITGTFVFFSIYYCKEVLSFKTGRTEGSAWIVMNDEFESLMRWNNWYVNSNWIQLYELRPKLEEMGVKKTDKVICYPDGSFSISLYHLDRDGWTNMIGLDRDKIETLKRKGAKYLITHDTELEKVDFLEPYRDNEVGRYLNIRVYKL